jgi:histidinol-phosphate aminotransferase
MPKPLVAPHLATLMPDVPSAPAGSAADSLTLTRNENPLGASPCVQSALLDATGQVHLYGDNDAHALRARLSEHLGVSAAEIALGHGSNALIELCARTFATPEQHAIIGAPSFSCYAASLSAAGVRTTRVPLHEGLFWDLSAVLAAVEPATKLVFLDNPGNPTSTHVASAALRGFLSALPEDIVAVVDEAYAEFADHTSYESALRMRGIRERLIVLRTFSKAYALAGLRVGYAVASREIIGRLRAVQVPFQVNRLAQVAAVAALADRAHLERCVALNSSERTRVSRVLRASGMAVAPSQTNFLLVGLPCPAPPVHQALCERGVIIGLPGAPLPHHLRFSLGLPAQNDRVLRELLDVTQVWMRSSGHNRRNVSP